MADIDGDDPKEYRWETGYEKTWEAIKEDEDGLLDSAIADIIQKAKRKRQTEKTKQNRLGMMRHLYVLLDCSEAMSAPDLKPTRMVCTLKLLELFVEEFFGQNPISQMGLIVLKSKRAEKLTELTGTPKLHLNALEGLSKINLVGEPSLQNGLELAIKMLKVLPSHASREVLIVMGSLTTCDPIDINITIDSLKRESIRCSVISLSAEIHVCRTLTQMTRGSYAAVLDDAHLRDLLMAHVDPPLATKKQENSLIKMGFPHGRIDESKDQPPLSLCMCHIDNSDEPSRLSSAGYHCPQCFSKYCELPVECQSCGLTLVSAPHLSRSYHHLLPVQDFTELQYHGQVEVCYACYRELNDTQDRNIYRCKSCAQFYCLDCDIFIHDTLHTCVGCNTIPSVAKQEHARKPTAPPGTFRFSSQRL